MRDASTPKLNLAIKIFHVDSFVVLFSSIFLLCGDLKFDLMFFIQLIWWIRTCQILKQFDQVKMFQILLYTLSNLFDWTNLIKLVWPCISSDISIVDWFKWLCYFHFLFKNSFGKPFCQNWYFSQSFCLFWRIPCYVWEKTMLFLNIFSDHSVHVGYLGFHMLLCLEHQVFLPLDYVITRTPKETKTRWSLGEILSSVFPV